ncbi:hypothetical protein BZA70DRAFT_285272 [Myxozyma melibiosi]|uniref:Anaphase-promoting complex subunit 15 n=1 Tax=Myxozyma melibiosi TaxID=54550 RepID=A0ABR1EY40_9ASCO
MMLSPPVLVPRDATSLWYNPSVKPHTLLRSRPRTAYLLGPTSLVSDELQHDLLFSEQPANEEQEFLNSLEADELRYARQVASIRTFGFTFLRPPGFTKTEQALLEEQAMSDSASEDNGFMENPNGELVMLDTDGAEAMAEDELEDATDDGEADDDLEYDDDVGAEDVDDGEEALDGWRRRQRRRRAGTAAEEEAEVDLDAEIPDGGDLGNYEDDEADEEDYEEQDLSQAMISEVEYEEDEDVTVDSDLADSHLMRNSSRVSTVPDADEDVEVDDDDDYDMAVESD